MDGADTYNEKIDELLRDTERKFEESLDDDLNMPEALAAMFELMNFVNSQIDEEQYSRENLVKTHSLLMKFDKVLGVLEHKKVKVPGDVIALVEDRESARKDKDFKKADKIRAEIKKKGFLVEDSPSGPRVKPV
jgi:cysteinyl-tRNA synthetase